MPEFKAIFYKKTDGTKSAMEFLLDLNIKMRAKMSLTIALLETNGIELREPYSKHIRDGVFELRAKVGSDISRILYFFVVNKRIILTHGFIKKTNKTPRSEIDRAERYRADYLSRKQDNYNE